jgi:ADP-heptose:LPS heptosyltransferase
VLTGTSAETRIAQQVRAAMRRPALDLCGRTMLFELGALVEHARLVVCNDTGISHIAAALGTPSVVVSSGPMLHAGRRATRNVIACSGSRSGADPARTASARSATRARSVCPPTT